jgi:hypothetical protein
MVATVRYFKYVEAFMFIIKFILEVVQVKYFESLLQKQVIENQHGIHFPK